MKGNCNIVRQRRDVTGPTFERDDVEPNPLTCQIELMTDRQAVARWISSYEAAWRAPGTENLSSLFTRDATYLQSPYEDPVAGLDAIAEMWEEEREGPDEVFSLSTEIVALDGDIVVVRAEVHYGEPLRQEYRDLWVFRLEDDGRCSRFEEWPYSPGHS